MRNSDRWQRTLPRARFRNEIVTGVGGNGAYTVAIAVLAANGTRSAATLNFTIVS
jgi:hypothetical protein